STWPPQSNAAEAALHAIPQTCCARPALTGQTEGFSRRDFILARLREATSSRESAGLVLRSRPRRSSSSNLDRTALTQQTQIITRHFGGPSHSPQTRIAVPCAEAHRRFRVLDRRSDAPQSPSSARTRWYVGPFRLARAVQAG